MLRDFASRLRPERSACSAGLVSENRIHELSARRQRRPMFGLTRDLLGAWLRLGWGADASQLEFDVATELVGVTCALQRDSVQEE